MNTIEKLIEKSFAHSETHRATDRRIYFRLYNCIKQLIIKNDLPSKESLPPTRLLAKQLSLSRSTILKAYDLLILEGFVFSKVGSGYQITEFHDTNPLAKVDKSKYIYAGLSSLGKSFLSNVDLMNSIDDKSVAFRPGVPPLDIFPVSKWKNLTNLYWRQIKSSALTYSPASGNEQLKKNLANYLNLSRGLKCNSNQIIIVSGTLQSLFLVGSVLLNEKDRVLVENPTFPNVHSVFKSLGANLDTVEVDDKGVICSQLKEKEAVHPKLIHTTPSCHYPTSAILDMDRRKELLSWANGTGSFIIENDYEHEISNFDQSLPSLFQLDEEDRVIYMGTFNRLLHPSIRIGYMVVPTILVNPIKALMKNSHRFVTPSIQVVLNQFIEKKFLFEHIKLLVNTAKQRKKIFIETFERELAGIMILQHKEYDSMHLVATFVKPQDGKKVANELVKHNILSHSLKKCYVSEVGTEGLIFGYASIKIPQIKQKVVRMAAIIKSVIK